MGWSFRKSFRIGKGMRLNLSKRGLGASFGFPGFRIGFGGGRSPRVTGGFGPFRYSKSVPAAKAARGASSPPSQQSRSGCGWLALIVVGLVIVGAATSLLDPSSQSPSESSAPKPSPAAPPQKQPLTAVSTQPIVSVDEAKKLAVARYPDLGVAGSVFNAEFLKRYKTYQSEKPDFLKAPMWPLTLADEVGTALRITPVPPPAPPKPGLRIRTELFRIGNYDYTINPREYTKSAFVRSTETRLTSSEQIIRVPFKQDLEIELTYDPLELAESGIFSEPSKFEVLSQEGNWRPAIKGGKGGLRTYKVSGSRAILMFHPWVKVPYGDGGKTKARLTLTTKDGSKFSREWTIQVGRNPEVYKDIW